ncbi:Stf0 family sulfotransferase [Rubellimicrobium roseum]|uniref:Stf0 sulfotransferase n=1 Tax=Rubellimicrobium roseum TaxID=687525 RepID=A0A5C4NIL8_9RHOB|nr:Stf0 family sulfotransferase [Rubellimicrobium roseum]TNC73715.1 Stf0 sulfotransferase [Rubellimicrobium roseum]
MDAYIICATPRTGSTLLCDLLASTKVAGCPDSYFMTDLDPVWVERWGFPGRSARDTPGHAASHLEAAKKVGRGQTGVFGLRLMRRDLDGLSALIGQVFPDLPSDRARLEAAFGRVLYIHLSRVDKLGQAVSLVKAEQTGLWHVAPDGTELERLAPPKEPAYDFDRIARKVAELEGHDSAWRTWFDEQGIEPLPVAYERLSADPSATLGRILGALGLPQPAPDALRPGVAKLADATTHEWMRRYHADSASTG